MTPPAGHQLVGRRNETAQLHRALSVSELPQVALAEVVGPQGIGKSALLTWLGNEAHRESFTVLHATAFRQEADQPYAVIASLIDATLAAAECRYRLDPFDIAALSSVLPNLRRAAQVAEPEPVEQIELLRAINAAMSILAKGSRGLVVIVDNSDWADDASFAALGYVCRRGVGAPLLVATAARTHRTDLSLRGAVQHVEDVSVGPMSDRQLSAIISNVPEDIRERILREAHGNPFFAVELASHAHAVESQQGNHDKSFPLSVTDAILDDIAAVPRPAQRLIHAAAVLGDGFATANAVELAGLSEAEGYGALDELVRAALLVPVQHGAFRFRHPVVGNVIYESLPPGTRLELHAHAATLLSTSGNDPIGAARHLMVCASVGDEDAVEVITFAAISTRALAPRASIEFTKAALQLIPDHGPLTAKRAFLQTIIADSLMRIGRFDEALRIVKQALAVLPRDDTTALAWLTTTLVRIQRWMGNNDSALDLIADALTKVSDEQAFERAILETLMMVEAGRAADMATAREYGTLSIRSADQSGEPFMKLTAMVARGLVEAMAGDAHTAMDFATRANELMDHLPTDQFILSLDGLALLCSVEDWVGRHSEALSTASRGRAASLESGNQLTEFWFALTAAVALTSLGRLGSAEETVESAEELARTLENPALTAISLALTAKIAAKEGDLVKAQRAADECMAYLELVKDDNLTLTAVGLVIPAVVALGRHAEAVELIARAGQTEDLSGIPVPQRAALFEQLAIAELGRSKLAAAQRWAQLADQNANEVDLAIARIPAARAAALVDRALGEPEASAAHAVEAVEAARGQQQPLELAQSLLVAGKSLSLVGKRDEAIAAYDEAGRVFAQSGAQSAAAHARQHLRDLGVRSRGNRGRSGSGGVEALSGREREVAEMVAEGLSNPQIAEQLFLSVRTVESHLSRIFTKLGATNRTDVAAAIRRNQIVNA